MVVQLEEVSEMLDFKACPRCRGDVSTKQDMYGKYAECLQCGYMVDIEDPNALLLVAEAREKKRVA